MGDGEWVDEAGGAWPGRVGRVMALMITFIQLSTCNQLD